MSLGKSLHFYLQRKETGTVEQNGFIYSVLSDEMRAFAKIPKVFFFPNKYILKNLKQGAL